MLRRISIFSSLAILLLLIGATAWAGDPNGAATLKADPGKAVDYVWVLLCGFLVMFMQAGFACVESGFCRAKMSPTS